MKNLKQTDLEIYKLVLAEEKRQKESLSMIPSENYASKAVMETLGSVLTNKYSEGFPGRRYYQGNKIIDDVERLAQERAKKLFGVPYVNVQALSGSPANSAVYLAALRNGDKMMGLSLSSGGHITHGHPLGLSGRLFKITHYELGKNGVLDYESIEKMALREKPQLIICGYTAYPRLIDFKRFARIADKVGAYLMADIAHIAGLVVGGVHESPVEHTHIITTTTHKTLRGPRGALIMVTEKGLKKNPELPKKIESAIIPGLQGGPHDNQTAAIAVALKEAAEPSFKKYAKQIVLNSKALAKFLIKDSFQLVSGGTDNHLILIDLRNKGINGAIAAYALEVAGIIVNKNAVPHDSMPPFYPSGIRLGTPAITTRGMNEKEMVKIAEWFKMVIDQVSDKQLPQGREERTKYFSKLKKELVKNRELLKIAAEVRSFTSNFPLP